MTIKKKNSVLYEVTKNRTLFIMLIPAIIYFLIFAYAPMSGLIIAFKNYNYRDGIFFSPWSGFDNFRFFFMSGKAFVITKNTMLYNVTFLVANVLVEVPMAIILSEIAGKYFKKFCQSLMFMPHFISWVVASAFVYNIFNFEYGILNSLLETLNIQPIDVYNTPSYWKFILPVFSVWKSVGFGTVIYLAAIMGMDAECYQAAEIDGAHVFQKIWHITVPLLVPTIMILVLLRMGTILRGDFQMFYQLIGDNGTLFDATDVIDTFVFRSLMNTRDMGMASAASFYQSVLCFLFIIGANSLARKFNKEFGLF